MQRQVSDPFFTIGGTQLNREELDRRNEQIFNISRPDMRAPWIGSFTPTLSVKPLSIWPEIGKGDVASYGKGADFPAVYPPADKKGFGIGLDHGSVRGKYTLIPTQEGYVKFPIVEQKKLYTPSADTLQAVHLAVDTRKQKSGHIRYFR